MSVTNRILQPILLLLLLVLAACDSVAPTPPTLSLSAVTPVALATLFPSPTALPPALATPTAPPVAEPPAEEPGWSFIITGDTWKDTPVLRRILSDATAAGDQFIIVCGDITPQGRPEQFAEFANVAATVAIPVYVAPGNHDIAYSGSTDYFEQYYPRHQSFDYNNLHVVIADDSTHSLSEDELAWLDADLTASAQPLKMVFMHVPPLLPFPVPDEDRMQSGATELMELATRHGVHTVFSAHLQAYAKMERDGVTYTITGGGGSPMHVPAILGGRYHYVRVTVKGDTASQDVVWLDDVATPVP